MNSEDDISGAARHTPSSVITMNDFFNKTPFSPNLLETRLDLSKFLVELLDPLAAYTSPGGARIHLGHTGTHYDEAAAQLEGFSCPLWGLASFIAGGSPYEGTKRWLTGFANGSDPSSAEFWGYMRDKDQRMVECSAIGFSLAVAKDQLWDPLSPQAKANLEAWLAGINDKEMLHTNWLWFRVSSFYNLDREIFHTKPLFQVFANLGLRKVGSSRFDAACMNADLNHLDSFYIGGGWSRDGPEGVIQLDSSSFAIQFAQLVYSKLAREFDPVRCEEYKIRARAFAQDFIHYFDPEGRSFLLAFNSARC